MSKKSQRKQLRRELHSDLQSAKERERRFGKDNYFNILMMLVKRNTRALVML